MESINIWGERDCLLPNGKPCRICCEALECDLDKGEVKSAGVPCRLMCEGGCSLHNTPQKPRDCVDYYCGNDDSQKRIQSLVSYASRNNLIDSATYCKAIKQITPRAFR